MNIEKSLQKKLLVYSPTLKTLKKKYEHQLKQLNHYHRKIEVMMENNQEEKQKERFMRNKLKKNKAEQQYKRLGEMLFKNYTSFYLQSKQFLKKINQDMIVMIVEESIKCSRKFVKLIEEKANEQGFKQLKLGSKVSSVISEISVGDIQDIQDIQEDSDIKHIHQYKLSQQSVQIQQLQQQTSQHFIEDGTQKTIKSIDQNVNQSNVNSHQNSMKRKSILNNNSHIKDRTLSEKKLLKCKKLVSLKQEKDQIKQNCSLNIQDMIRILKKNIISNKQNQKYVIDIEKQFQNIYSEEEQKKFKNQFRNRKNQYSGINTEKQKKFKQSNIQINQKSDKILQNKSKKQLIASPEKEQKYAHTHKMGKNINKQKINRKQNIQQYKNQLSSHNSNDFFIDAFKTLTRPTNDQLRPQIKNINETKIKKVEDKKKVIQKLFAVPNSDFSMTKSQSLNHQNHMNRKNDMKQIHSQSTCDLTMKLEESISQQKNNHPSKVIVNNANNHLFSQRSSSSSSTRVDFDFFQKVINSSLQAKSEKQ